MIDHVRGQVSTIGLDHVVIDAGGFGMRIEATPATLAALRTGDEATVVTEFIVRQDAMLLYGFADDDERTCFRALQTVTGVGARTALAVLAVHNPDELRQAVATDDITALQKVPGIGKKSASRMVLELKDKLGAPCHEVPAASPVSQADPSVADALVGLGWQLKAAEAAVETVYQPGMTTAQILRAALQHLGGKK